MRISPGCELLSLVVDLQTFAQAVLYPGVDDVRTTGGAIAYSAGAWPRDIGKVTGALPPSGRLGRAGSRDPDHGTIEPDPTGLGP